MICHGPWTLVEAGVVRGRTLTSYPSVRTDIRNAGGNVVDQEVVTDQNITSSRWPDDLSAFCARIVEQFAAPGSGHRPGRPVVHRARVFTAGGIPLNRGMNHGPFGEKILNAERSCGASTISENQHPGLTARPELPLAVAELAVCRNEQRA